MILAAGTLGTIVATVVAFLVLTLGLVALLLFVKQKLSLVDSITKLVNNKKDYNQKIDFLQKNIKEIYATKFDETIALAQLGYNLANEKNDIINKGDFLRTIGLSLGKKGNIDSASVYYYRALQVLEPTKNTEKLGLLYDDMARMYRKLRQPNRALEFYEKVAKNNYKIEFFL